MAKDVIIVGGGGSGGGAVSITDPTDPKTVDGWVVQEAEETTGTSYYGKTRESGVYRIDRVVQSGDSYTVRFASITNNPTKTTFATAWTDRATLTYDYLEDV